MECVPVILNQKTRRNEGDNNMVSHLYPSAMLTFTSLIVMLVKGLDE